MDTNDVLGAGLISLLIWLGICILIFLAIRAIMLWYWKVDKLVANQETQIQLLRELVSKNKSETATKP